MITEHLFSYYSLLFHICSILFNFFFEKEIRVLLCVIISRFGVAGFGFLGSLFSLWLATFSACHLEFTWSNWGRSFAFVFLFVRFHMEEP